MLQTHVSVPRFLVRSLSLHSTKLKRHKSLLKPRFKRQALMNALIATLHAMKASLPTRASAQVDLNTTQLISEIEQISCQTGNSKARTEVFCVMPSNLLDQK